MITKRNPDDNLFDLTKMCQTEGTQYIDTVWFFIQEVHVPNFCLVSRVTFATKDIM